MKGKSRELSFWEHSALVEIQGISIENLITKLIENGVSVRSIKCLDESRITLIVKPKHLGILQREAGYKYQVKVLKYKGILPIITNVLHNKRLMAGAVLFAVFFLVQSMFIKEIDINGYTTLTEGQIRSALAESGLQEGGSRFVNLKDVEKALYRDFDNLVYGRVRIQGRYVQVDVSEGLEKDFDAEEVLKNEKPCDLVAPCDCYIESIKVFAGRGVCQAGDYMEKGKVLISGTVPIEYSSYTPKEGDPAYMYMHARGEVVAKIPYFYTFKIKEKDLETAKKLQREWIKKNIPENAQILNKSLNFSSNRNIIEVYGKIETRQRIGIEKEISVAESRPSKNTN